MSDRAVYLYESIVDDSYGRFEHKEPEDIKDEDLRTTLNPYLIEHYLDLVYVRHELLYNAALTKKYEALLKYYKADQEITDILNTLTLTDIVSIITEYLAPSLEAFKIRHRLHYDLEMVFNDNKFSSGGMFYYMGPSTIRRIRRISVVGSLPNVNASRRSRVGYRWHRYCEKYLQQKYLYEATMGFERPDGFYSCPTVLYKICL